MRSKRRASAKAQRQEPALCGQEKARKPVQLKPSKHGGAVGSEVREAMGARACKILKAIVRTAVFSLSEMGSLRRGFHQRNSVLGYADDRRE